MTRKYSICLIHSYVGQKFISTNDLVLATNKILFNLRQWKYFQKFPVYKMWRTICDLLFLLQPWYLYNSYFRNSYVSTPFQKEILVGNISPHIFSLYQTILETIKLWVDISLKQHLVMIGCGHFYKIALLVMEKGVWLIPVVWSVWLVWIAEIVVSIGILVLLLLLWFCCVCDLLVRMIPQWSCYHFRTPLATKLGGWLEEE